MTRCHQSLHALILGAPPGVKLIPSSRRDSAACPSQPFHPTLGRMGKGSPSGCSLGPLPGKGERTPQVLPPPPQAQPPGKLLLLLRGRVPGSRQGAHRYVRLSGFPLALSHLPVALWFSITCPLPPPATNLPSSHIPGLAFSSCVYCIAGGIVGI